MSPRKRYFVYRLAGQTIVFDQPVLALQAFVSHNEVIQVPTAPTWPIDLAEREPTIKASGWIGDGFSTVSVWHCLDRYIFEIPRAGVFWITADGRYVGQLWREPQADGKFLTDALLGPPLVMALARQGIWCLHCSAIGANEGLVAFVGESGAGKSTLAAYLNSQAGQRRLVDDILPIAWENDSLQARPQFPQLKLPIDQQPASGFPESLPVFALYILDERPEISFHSLSPSQAAMAMARGSVATRLFDRQQLEQHLAFCSQAAAHTTIRRLAYPRELNKLPEVWEALQADLDALKG
jgi:hypothetical protein